MLTGLAALLVAGCVWIPCLHMFFSKPATEFHTAEGLSPKAQRLAAWHLRLWNEPELREWELRKMRASNAEWDFMGRSFLVWSLANMGLREPASKAAYLETMDRIIEETTRLENKEGMYFFLMPYAKGRAYEMQPAHSLFLDGEIAMMLAARRMLEEKADYKPLLTARVEAITERFRQSPHLMLESYPEECWMFDHVVALDAIRMADCLDGTDSFRADQRMAGDGEAKAGARGIRPADQQLHSGRHCAGRPRRIEHLDDRARVADSGRKFCPGPILPGTRPTGRDDARVQLRARMARVLGRPGGC